MIPPGLDVGGGIEPPSYTHTVSGRKIAGLEPTTTYKACPPAIHYPSTFVYTCRTRRCKEAQLVVITSGVLYQRSIPSMECVIDNPYLVPFYAFVLGTK